MGLIRITEPLLEPVSLAEAKLWCRISNSLEDTEVTVLIRAVRELCERRIRRTLVDSTWELQLEAFAARMLLPMSPLLELLSVKYLPLGGGAEQTLSASVYVVDQAGTPPAVQLADGASWPAVAAGRPDAVRIRYRAGFAESDGTPPVPGPLLTWMRLHLAHYYDGRSATVRGQLSPLPYADELLHSYRLLSF